MEKTKNKSELKPIANNQTTLRTKRFKYVHTCTNKQMKNMDGKSKFFKALGDPIRLKIIDHLMKNNSPVCVCDLSKTVKRDVSVIFRHAQLLKDVGIIETRKENKFLMCKIKDKTKMEELLK